MIQPLYLKNILVENNKIVKLYNILLNKYSNKIKLIIFNIISKNNNIYKPNNIKLYNNDAALIPKHHSTHNFDIFFESRDF